MFVRKARIKDAVRIFETVNLSYKLELGRTGIAFKKENRYVNLAEVKDDIRSKDGQFFYVQESESSDKTCLGCIFAKATKDKKAVSYGPFAVHPSHQKRGIGTLLQETVYSYARKLGFHNIQILVVNHRTDLYKSPTSGFYPKRGYKMIKKLKWTDVEGCVNKSLTRPSFFFMLQLNLESVKRRRSRSRSVKKKKRKSKRKNWEGCFEWIMYWNDLRN